MKTTRGDFEEMIETGQTYWVVRNQPNNEITGRWHTPEDALAHGLPGDVIYCLHVVESRQLVMVIPERAEKS